MTAWVIGWAASSFLITEASAKPRQQNESAPHCPGSELPAVVGRAQAAGIKGIRVEKPEDLHAAVREALEHEGPVLVDVVSERQELIMPPTTTVDQAKHFGLFMMKAVLDGRAHELIDLARVNLDR